MILGTLFVIAPNTKQPKCPSTVTWTGKLLCVHTMRYYTEMSINKLQLHTATWGNFANITLSGRSNTQTSACISGIFQNRKANI